MRAGWILLTLWPGLAWADEVVLKEGQTLRGRVLEDGVQVVLQIDGGRISFPAEAVSEVRREVEHPLAKLEARRRALSSGDVPGRLALAREAIALGLRAEASALHREVLELDPNRAESRAALGYVRRDGRWLSEDEARSADGLIRYGGRWIPRAEADALEAAQAARRVAPPPTPHAPPEAPAPPVVRSTRPDTTWGNELWLDGPPPLATAGWSLVPLWWAPPPAASAPGMGFNVRLSGTLAPRVPASVRAVGSGGLTVRVGGGAR